MAEIQVSAEFVESMISMEAVECLTLQEYTEQLHSAVMHECILSVEYCESLIDCDLLEQPGPQVPLPVIPFGRIICAEEQPVMDCRTIWIEKGTGNVYVCEDCNHG